VLDVRLPYLLLPVRPGRNIAVIIEVAALNHRLKEMGIHTAQRLNERILGIMHASQG
jgi:HPr kinase/phosphorylase